MNAITETTYSSKAVAKRGALRKGLTEGSFALDQLSDGRWVVTVATSEEQDHDAEIDEAQNAPAQAEAEAEDETPSEAALEAEALAIAHEELAKEEAAANVAPVDETPDAPAPATVEEMTEAEKPAKGPTYRQLAEQLRATEHNYQRSTIINPVQFAHRFFDENPHLTRKQAVTALIDKGMNFATARAQYQRWFAKRSK